MVLGILKTIRISKILMDLQEPGSIVRFEPVSGIHPGELDPGETMWCNVAYNGAAPIWFQVTTGNGIYASAYIPTP